VFRPIRLQAHEVRSGFQRHRSGNVSVIAFVDLIAVAPRTDIHDVEVVLQRLINPDVRDDGLQLAGEQLILRAVTRAATARRANRVSRVNRRVSTVGLPRGVSRGRLILHGPAAQVHEKVDGSTRNEPEMG
jgi:hypothetical protein